MNQIGCESIYIYESSSGHLVESFDENAIIMNTSQGDLIVRGTGLHIGRISLDVGQLSVEGSISELSYEDKAPSGGFWQKLFG